MTSSASTPRAPAVYSLEDRSLFEHFKQALNHGEIRAAEPDPGSPTGWRVNAWVKQGILAGFRMGEIVDMSVGSSETGVRFPFLDKATIRPGPLVVGDGVRVVPGGSSIRDGCYLGRGGDLHAAHVHQRRRLGGRRHAGGFARPGGELRPGGPARPPVRRRPTRRRAGAGGRLAVIVEDDVLIGGNCGVYEGTVVKRRAVLGAGTILTRSTPVYDLVRETIHRATDDQPLVIPEEAVRRARIAGGDEGSGKGLGALPLHAGDRQVSRRFDGRAGAAGGLAAVGTTVQTMSLPEPAGYEEIYAALPLLHSYAALVGGAGGGEPSRVPADHAVCEQQFAMYALSLASYYPHDVELVERVAALAAEEVQHFRRVVAILKQRGWPLGGRRKNPWAQSLRDRIVPGREPWTKSIACCSGPSSRRGAASGSPGSWRSSKIRKSRLLLADLGPAERRHWELFYKLAGRDVEPDALAARFLGWREFEAKLARGLGVVPGGSWLSVSSGVLG